MAWKRTKPRDDGLVLEPRVEDVAEDVEGLGVGFYGVEPADNARLVLPMVGDVGCAEVEVGGEVNLLHWMGRRRQSGR